MSRETLEDWICGIENETRPVELKLKYGVYNDLMFYFSSTDQQRIELIELLNKNKLFTHMRSDSQKLNFYKTDLVDIESFSVKENNYLRFEFPNKGIDFEEGTLPMSGNEIGHNYSGSMQLSLFGKYSTTVEALSIIAREFILEKKIPSYVSTVNCKDEKYKNFSVFINE